jgi:methylthioribose-1-phosphate isomerase
VRTIRWQDGTVITIDQTKLPLETVTLRVKTVAEMAEAIKNLRVRGAPLLGAAAAYGLALAANNSNATCKSELLAELEDAAQKLKSTRPTAVNLFWAADRVLDKARDFWGSKRLWCKKRNESQRKMQRRIGLWEKTALY